MERRLSPYSKISATRSRSPVPMMGFSAVTWSSVRSSTGSQSINRISAMSSNISWKILSRVVSRVSNCPSSRTPFIPDLRSLRAFLIAPMMAWLSGSSTSARDAAASISTANWPNRLWTCGTCSSVNSRSFGQFRQDFLPVLGRGGQRDGHQEQEQEYAAGMDNHGPHFHGSLAGVFANRSDLGILQKHKRHGRAIQLFLQPAIPLEYE